MSMDSFFLGRVGHDLRGELATMVAGLHYLLRYERDLSPTARQMLDRVNGAGQRLRHLLDEFDHAAWIDGGDKSTLHLEAVEIADLMTATVDKLAPVIEAHHVTVDRKVPPALPHLSADREIFSVALEYLLDFAVARSEGRRVRITCEADGEQVRILVADAGPAVPEASLATIFDQFAMRDLIPRGDPGQKRRERLGLGLAIARGIVKAHGGTLTALPTAGGEGLTLRVEMPVQEAAALDRAG